MDVEGAAELDRALAGMLAGLAPAERKKLARHIARTLRKVNAARIAAQVDPDGTRFADRSPDTYRPSFRHGVRDRRRTLRKRVRRPLFQRLRSARHLRASWTADEAGTGFANPATARIAKVHHFGLRDQVYRGGALSADYPQRELLGTNEADRNAVLEQIVRHLSAE